MVSPMSDAKRLIWDFFGPRAEGTAQHFAKHLGEFFARESLPLVDSGVAEEADLHWTAFCEVDEATAEVVRTALRPQREQ